MSAKKVVLVSKSGYDPRHDGMLRGLIDDNISVFCVVGKDCQRWEEVMDELVVGPDGSGDLDIVTTSHSEETVAEVVEFAERFDIGEPSEVRVIEV
jgi:hypothetical protein